MDTIFSRSRIVGTNIGVREYVYKGKCSLVEGYGDKPTDVYECTYKYECAMCDGNFNNCVTNSSAELLSGNTRYSGNEKAIRCLVPQLGDEVMVNLLRKISNGVDFEMYLA